VSRTRIARLLAGYRNRPPVDHEAIYEVLEKISAMLADLPDLAELDINPLLADEHGVIALDARAVAVASGLAGSERFAIRPYPDELEESVVWNGRTLLLRPVLPQDESRHAAFLRKVDTTDMRMRFFYSRRSFTHKELVRFTQIDYEREMAFVAVTTGDNGDIETLGVVRAITDPDNTQTEMAIVIRSDLKGGGLGVLLLEKMIRYCRGRGTTEMVASILPGNTRMLALARRMGFTIHATGGDPVEARLLLQAA
jgi:acetyltransferase